MQVKAGQMGVAEEVMEVGEEVREVMVAEEVMGVVAEVID